MFKSTTLKWSIFVSLSLLIISLPSRAQISEEPEEKIKHRLAEQIAEQTEKDRLAQLSHFF